MILDDAPCVRFIVLLVAFRCASGDIVVSIARPPNVLINGIIIHVHRILLFVRCSAHVSNTFIGRPGDDVRVVALHLGERLLENHGPNNFAGSHLGRPRPSIFEWDEVVDDDGLRHAENEEIDAVATILLQTLLKHFFHAFAG